MATKAPAKRVRITSKEVREHREKQKGTRDYSPKWDGAESWTGDQFTKHFRESMKWYNLEHSGKTLKPEVINWMGRNGYSKTQIQKFKKTKDSRCGITMGSIAACLNKGMPKIHPGFNNGRSTVVWLENEILQVIEKGKYDIDQSETTDNKQIVYNLQVPSIQERVRNAAFAMTTEIENALENFHTDPEKFDPKDFKILNLLRGKGAKSAHARVIREHYSKTHAELEELLGSNPDSQLIEGYKHRTKKQIKSLFAFYSEIVNACGMIAEEAKSLRKPRKVKTVSKDKLISKLKYKKNDDALKLVSVNPVDIIGSKELWVFDTKTRKLGKYIAGEFNNLGIKGTTITGFDEIKSVQKTLRKPLEQLKEFKSSGKVALRKFLDTINAVDIKLNGRINENQILLKLSQ